MKLDSFLDIRSSLGIGGDRGGLGLEEGTDRLPGKWNSANKEEVCSVVKNEGRKIHNTEWNTLQEGLHVTFSKVCLPRGRELHPPRNPWRNLRKLVWGEGPDTQGSKSGILLAWYEQRLGGNGLGVWHVPTVCQHHEATPYRVKLHLFPLALLTMGGRDSGTFTLRKWECSVCSCCYRLLH